MNIVICHKADNISWEDLANLLHEAFQERLQQGLQFICSSITAAQLERECEGCVVLVAIDEDTNALAGTVSIKLNDIDSSEPWAYHFNLAVSPAYKHCGIATRLFEEFQSVVQSQGCHYIISDTAVDAKSSVDWHLKNGFRIIKLHSFAETNYYSYVFRKQLKQHPFWSNRLFCKIHYWFSALKCKATFKANGESRYLMSLYIRLRN